MGVKEPTSPPPATVIVETSPPPREDVSELDRPTLVEHLLGARGMVYLAVRKTTASVVLFGASGSRAGALALLGRAVEDGEIVGRQEAEGFVFPVQLNKYDPSVVDRATAESLRREATGEEPKE